MAKEKLETLNIGGAGSGVIIRARVDANGIEA
jgi:hypothetical protein